MHITKGRRSQCGLKIVDWVKFSPEFIVRNRLSKKPQEAAKKLREMVEGTNAIVKNSDVSIRQNYGNGTVTLNLLSQSFSADASGNWAKGTDQGQDIVRSTVLPATAAVKRYTKALREMVENPVEEITQTSTPVKSQKKWYQLWM